LKSVIENFGAELVRVEITDLRDGTFYARLILRKAGSEVEIDSRPSDAMALALRCSAPIFVAEKVMDEAGRPANGEDDTSPEGSTQHVSEDEARAAKAAALISKLKKDLEKAIQDERYEDAARIRDELKRLENVH
jgi:bifunctional DNase/RNase